MVEEYDITRWEFTEVEDEQLNKAAAKLSKAFQRVRGRADYDLTGYYFDPKHGGCLRTIFRYTDTTYALMGAYGDDEVLTQGDLWSGKIEIKAMVENHIPFRLVFTGKETSKEYIEGKFMILSKTLEFSDNNTWLPMYAHPKQLLPNLRPYQLSPVMAYKFRKKIQRKPLYGPLSASSSLT